MLKDSTCYNFSPNRIFNLLDFKLHKQIQQFVSQSSPGRWEYVFQKKGSISFVNRYRPYNCYNWEEDSLNYSKLMKDPKTFEYSEVKINHFIQLINELSKKNRVVLVDLPERKRFDKLVKSYEDVLFSRIEAKSKMRIKDFGVYNDSLFYDSHHLNSEGSRIFSNKIIEFIFHEEYDSSLIF